MFKKIAAILRENGNDTCLEKAKTLENESYFSPFLNLRSLSLMPTSIRAISDIIEKEDAINFKSISFSYNQQLGDIGATAVAKKLPLSITEIGLVACGISDTGGTEILQWMEKSTHLKMICMEQNNFSDQLKIKFNAFKKRNPQIIVVI